MVFGRIMPFPAAGSLNCRCWAFNLLKSSRWISWQVLCWNPWHPGVGNWRRLSLIILIPLSHCCSWDCTHFLDSSRGSAEHHNMLIGRSLPAGPESSPCFVSVAPLYSLFFCHLQAWIVRTFDYFNVQHVAKSWNVELFKASRWKNRQLSFSLPSYAGSGIKMHYCSFSKLLVWLFWNLLKIIKNSLIWFMGGFWQLSRNAYLR